MSLQRIRHLIRELRARGRNYRHAAILRRYVRAKHGAVVTAHRSILVGEALVTLCQVRWARVTILAALVLAAAART